MEAWYGVDGEPTLVDAKYARVKREYKEDKLTESYFGRDRKPANCDRGYARKTQKLDDKGRVLDRAFYDENAKLVVVRKGCGGFAEQALVVRGSLHGQWVIAS